MRGAPKIGGVILPVVGLIPARAGSTSSTFVTLVNFRAHPRPCGEHHHAYSRPCNEWGSSPPVRGAQNGPGTSAHYVGLIPARAGSTSPSACWPMSAWAHPRPCGEHIPDSLKEAPHGGSSPPVRGALPTLLTDPFNDGLIPARAGSTFQLLDLLVCWWAHPRPCGEHG